MTILIFPSPLSASIKFSSQAKNWGHKTLGASSLDNDDSSKFYDEWLKLPVIGDANFFNQLNNVIAQNSVSAIYTPHAPTFHLLQNSVGRIHKGVTLVGEGPFQTQMNKVRSDIQRGNEMLEAAFRLTECMPDFTPEFVGGLVAQAESIHGECSQEKMAAIFGVMSQAPKGDIVEIGALFGKSSYLFNRIGAYLGVGATLAIDPWNLALSVQHDAPVHIQKASCGWEWDIVASGFLMNMLAASAPPFNYIRATSRVANEYYSKKHEITSKEFGRIQYVGEISVLHIDGNHDEEAVSEDFAIWHPHMAPNGWIVFDDYNWAHGDGPKNVANRVIGILGKAVKRHFVAGGALFMNLE